MPTWTFSHPWKPWTRKEKIQTQTTLQNDIMLDSMTSRRSICEHMHIWFRYILVCLGCSGLSTSIQAVVSARGPAISPSHPGLSTPSGGSILEWWASSVSPIHPLGHWAHVNVMNYWENGYYWFAVGIIEGVNCSEREGGGLEGGRGSLSQRTGQTPQVRFKCSLRRLTSKTVRSEVAGRTRLTLWWVRLLHLVA